MNKGKELKRFIKGMLYLTPALLVIGIFQIYPIIKALSMSFYTRYNYFKHIVFEYGIDNYIQIFKDKNFILALKNTFIFEIGRAHV